MEYLVTQAEMKEYDKNTIERLKMPSIVLMERAALVTAEQVRKMRGDTVQRVLVVGGCGNNGGDGFAIGRLLMQQGRAVDFVLLGNREKCSKETALELDILAKYGYEPYDTIPEGEYDIVIDAIFGVGLSRNIEGIYEDAVLAINNMHSFVCAVDIPSGVHADTGQILGCAVKADVTVAYGFYKLGELLYPGRGYCGKIICGQIGIDEYSFFGEKPCCYTYTSLADVRLPKRKSDGNKGTFGKALVIAGSSGMCGAALMACRSVFKTGAGMVRAVTSFENRETLRQALPEAMLTVYKEDLWQEDEPDACFLAEFEKALSWADAILIGPGSGVGKAAAWLLRYCIKNSRLPMVIDADGLNLLSEERNLLKEFSGERKIILTPHMGEFARLYGCTVPEAAEHIMQYPKKAADTTHCIVVCKDVRTVVAIPQSKTVYLNTSGNDGMATAGSGDVLAGMITGLLLQGMEAEQAAVTGVYLHGVAGDMAAKEHGRHSMMATDIIEQIQELLKKLEERHGY